MGKREIGRETAGDKRHPCSPAFFTKVCREPSIKGRRLRRVEGRE